MTTILDALRNAKYNLVNKTTLAHKKIGQEQLKNAVILLDKGYPLDFVLNEFLSTYEDPELAPDFKDSIYAPEEPSSKKPRDSSGKFTSEDNTIELEEGDVGDDELQ